MAGSHESPFKMKGSGHYGLGNSSPLTKRSLWKKAKDEAGQLWEGAKALVTAEDRGIDKAQRAYLNQEQKDRAND